MYGQILLFVFIYLLTYLIILLFKRINYYKSFEKRNIPGPKPNLLFGNFFEFKSEKNNNEIIKKWSKKYGKIFGYYIGQKRYLIINDLDMLNQIFISNASIFYNREDFAINAKYLIDSLIAIKNEKWHLIRKIVSPLFSLPKINSGFYDKEMKDCIDESILQIRKNFLESELIDKTDLKEFEVNVFKLIQSFTLDVISRTSLNLNENVYDKKNYLINCVTQYFSAAGNFFFEISLFFPLFKNILTFLNNNISSGKLINTIVRELENHIKIYVKQYNENQSNDYKVEEKALVLTNLLKKFTAKSITKNELIGNILIVLFAGFETTANSITYALYLLAKYPNIQTKLRNEINENGINSKYLDMFWYENLRYYPPVTLFVKRVCSKNCKIGDFDILKDDIIQAPVWEISRDAKYWENPDVFDPERFEPEKRKKFHSCQFLSYGVGHRICVGLNFANREAKLFLIKFLTEYKIETCEKTPKELTFITPTVIINPVEDVILKLIKI